MSNALWMTAGVGDELYSAEAAGGSAALTATGHDLAEQQQVTVRGATGGAAVLVEGAPYWVRNVVGDSFELSPAPGAPVMEYSTSGTVAIHAMNAVYSARDLRRFSSALMPPGEGGLSTVTGIRPGTEIASISAATVTVNPFSGVVQPSGDDWPDDNGPYTFIVPAELVLQVPPADTQDRIDSLVLRIQDNDNELTGVSDATVYIKEGTPGSGFPPATRESEVQLGTIYVPTVGAPDLNLKYRHSTALGGVEPVRSEGGLPDAGLYEGRYADVSNQEALYRYSGTEWRPVASTRWPRGIIASSGLLLSSSEFGTSEVVVRQSSDSAPYAVTFQAEAGRHYRIDVAIEAVDKTNSGNDDDSTRGSKGAAMFTLRAGGGSTLSTSLDMVAQIQAPVFDNAAAHAGGAHFAGWFVAESTGMHVCGVTAHAIGTPSTIRALRAAGSAMNQITVADMGRLS